uniref:Photosystem I reaction center subunit VIII n=1 Tax=Euglena viridis TaxID=3040 RepID=M1EWG0_EUGVI|nr:photosystem I 4 kDa polypeptide subunit [Euglena viridis]AEY70839.1 photosystem I 4 kDa polypeptide subunit [Euglena viridis]
MSASFLPSIFVSLVGLVFPFVTLWLFYKFIESESIN